HPNSILWRSSYEPTEPEFDILGDERPFWGQRGVHYHRNLRPGENTLNLKLVRAVLELVRQSGEYRRDAYIERYLAILRAPALHRDTYLEECHRGFFLNLRRGRRPEKCAVKEKHIGGLAPVVPLYAQLRALGYDDEPARASVREHVAVTHAGDAVLGAVNDLLVVASELWSGAALRDVLGGHARRQDLRFFTGPVERLESRPDDEVVGRVWSTACYLEDSLPATFYLAWKHADSPREALVSNVMVGGDNCHRGAVIGALAGLSGGEGVFPPEWRFPFTG
ncbi:MAG TPA: ADP-ribosylglycohydrolase family protein, partial [Spirochaetia bacterium]|nr:ADP-ribosylglycohydrolase family protein [Spirochaetia bacterium]